MKTKTFAVSVASIAVAIWAEVCSAAYPGNPDFRNLPVTFAAKTRTEWFTNITTMVGKNRNPGVSTPINWSKAISITKKTKAVADSLLFAMLICRLNKNFSIFMHKIK